MIRFVDLETGNTFDGSDQYIFWFDNEQSINLIYSKPICFISDKEEINISIEKNDIFKLIDSDKISNKNKYHDINKLYTTSLKSIGSTYNACYVHIIYIICSSNYEGEYICNFYINNEKYKIGADFYGADESLYINLSNNGVEIPEGVQKAIYSVNVHEDKCDNITLNRKWKELLSNYWDIVANKGSYKSLYNSLNWFEYGDMLRLCELWKYDNYGTKYEISDLQSTLKDKYEKLKNNFAKTTYIALYCSLEKIKTVDGKIIYDEDKNPVLEKISHKWSDIDLSLKMSMLGSFYETYFMPIHLDLIHSTIENITFANTTKLDISATINRTDYVYHHDDIKCNIKDNDVFYLDKVDCYVNPDTLFKKTTLYENMVGISKNQYIGKYNNEQLKLYANQLYSGAGAIIDFEIDIPLQDNDFIKKETIIIVGGGYTDRVFDYKIIKDKKIKFSIFRPSIGVYNILLQFDSANGCVYTKTVKVIIKDTEHDDIRIYKIVHKSEDAVKSIDCFTDNDEINNYIYIRNSDINVSNNKYINYIPVLKHPNTPENHEGACTNHLMIFNCYYSYKENGSADIVSPADFYYNTANGIPDKSKIYNYEHQGNGLWSKCFEVINELYDIKFIWKNTYTKEKLYLLCVSKKFGFNMDMLINEINNVSPEAANYFKTINNSINNNFIDDGHVEMKGTYLYKSNDIFVPCYHELVELNAKKMHDINQFIVSDKDALCVIPTIEYSKIISGYSWEFINMSDPKRKSIKLENSIMEPFITNDTEKFLDPGYYSIKFRYKYGDKTNTITLDSAFKKI